MSRHNEREKAFKVILQGGIRVEPRKQIGILVARVPIPKSPHLSQDPFWAYTLEYLDRCELDGVKLRGGIMIPWDTLTSTGGLVSVKSRLLKREMIPIIDLQSLQKLR